MPDYSDPGLWAFQGETRCDGEPEADVAFVCPTVDLGLDGHTNMDLADADVRAAFKGATNMERGDL